MREKIKLGVLTALIALLAMGVTAWAAPPPSGEAEPTDFDIYRTGIPDYDLVWQFYTEFDIGSLEHMPRAGVPRPDGYYWVLVPQEERDTIDQMVEELQRIMGDDFPVAVSVSSSAPIDEAAVAALQAALTRLLDNDIYRTGNPDLELVSEFYEQFDIGSLRFWEYADDCPYIVGMGVRVDGYLWLTIAEENWDVIYGTVAELRQIMGEDFPIAVSLQNYRPLSQANRTAGSESATGETTATSSDVFGGHTCVIQRYLSSSQQTLAFAAASAGQAGMVLSGHWLDK